MVTHPDLIIQGATGGRPYILNRLLTLNQIAELFGRDKAVISRHLRNIFQSEELERSAVVAKNATTAADDKTYQVDYYNPEGGAEIY